MILPRCLIQLSIIDAHPPSRNGSLWYQLLLLIFHNRESPFLRNAMHGAYPFTMWYGVYYSGIQQFDNLLLHHITHSMAQPSLMFYDRLVLLLELYTMCAKSGANNFQVVNRVADHLFVLLQYIQELLRLFPAQFVANNHRKSVAISQKFIFQSLGEWLHLNIGRTILFLI